ncbi:MAG: hypothetical protein H6797_01020 [Candidatus Nomurabacteria bacterium]|nr:MAG: hypothetical protein H6797_01020 [Candidatus Nomurabacteria bacterium]
MELIVITIIGFILALVTGATLLGMTIHDIRKIRLESQLRSRPRIRFKKLPLVSIYVDGTPSNKCMESIWNNDYRKIEIKPLSQPINGKLILRLKSDYVLEKSAINYAVHRLEKDRSLVVVELSPVLQFPDTFGQLLHAYRLIAAAPFASSRAGFGIALTHPLNPILIRPSYHKNMRTKTYAITRWFAFVACIVAQIYACFLALFLYQPILLIGCLSCFWLWMVAAITHYPHLSFRQRIFYALLIPTSLGYIVLLGICAVVKSMFYRSDGEAKQSPWESAHKRIVAL